jgi:hypothetical protein
MKTLFNITLTGGPVYALEYKDDHPNHDIMITGITEAEAAQLTNRICEIVNVVWEKHQ